MKYVISAVILVILVMIVVMFIILKKIVRIVNEQSKNYFLTKLQSYDNIILEKENKLKEINSQILLTKEKSEEKSENQENEKKDYYYSDDIPEYQEENFLEQFKKIDETFNFDNEKIVRGFLQNNQDIISDKYKTLIAIKEKLNFDLIYDLQINSLEYQLNVLKNLLVEKELEIFVNYLEENNDFDIVNFQNYIDDQISLNDPSIYIKVSNVSENYDHLDSRIKTIYDKRIIKGIAIIYKNKIYDYALR